MTHVALSPWAARTLAYLFRFRTLQLAEYAFKSSGPGRDDQRSVSVRLFGLELPLKVSRSVTHKMLCLEGERFIQERDLLRSLIAPGDVIVDVGANIGYLDLLFLQSVGPTGKLICVEPDNENFEELCHCMRVNGRTDVVLIQAAVGNEMGTVHLSPGLNGRVSDEGSTAVPLITVDSLFEHHPDFIKIDVEGYEEMVIDGAMMTLRERCPTVFIELHPYLVPNRPDIRRILTKLDAIYDQIELVEYRVSDRAVIKLLMRYGLTSAVSVIEDRERLLSQVEASERDQPFWAICQRAKSRG